MAINPLSMIDSLVREGSVEVALPGGVTRRLGDGSEPTLVLRVNDMATIGAILRSPILGVGEAYMDGRLVIERGGLDELFALALRNRANRPPRRRGPLARWWASRRREMNARRAAGRNVRHHYDLSEALYRAFLDADMQYSCAYFARPDMSLDEAQEAKKRHLAAKLRLSPGQRVLDIGSGWGGLALSLARWSGAEVLGVTLSPEQLAAAQARARSEGLAGQVRFSLTDYRDVEGTFERIVSVGMFEHVGRPNYQAFFDAVARLLAEDGVALIHTIGRGWGPGATDGFTARYIFPGGYIPALSEILPHIELAGLRVDDIETLRLHYAMTLRCWRDNFAAHREAMRELYDERFCRMWEFYLAASEVGFRSGLFVVYQIQLTRRVATLPITRGYMEEETPAAGTSARPPPPPG